MFRTPPRARTGSRWIVLLTVVGVCVAIPGVALAGPKITIDDQVTGREPLTLSVAGVASPLTVTAVDSAGGTATWRVAEPAASVALDLLAPDEGAPPVNGPLAVAVALDDVTLLEAHVTLDATPPAPSLGATSSGSRVALQWSEVPANGPVTYLLQRTGGGGVWTTLLDGAATSFVDKGLATDWYRYRLTAAIPAAGDGRNTSQADDVVLHVAAPAPAPAPTPVASEPEAEPRDRTRRGEPVAAAGGIRRAVKSDRPRRRREPVTSYGIAYAPRVADRMERWNPTVVPAPNVAAARVPADPNWTPYEHRARALRPVIVPPPGTLAIDATRAAQGTTAGTFVGLLAFGAAGIGAVMLAVSERRLRKAARLAADISQ